ncbi:glutathione S-transferase [Roseomonas fluvialis]|uniref:Glutathione S-transferase n=1 Tax=Roseomonas fluvialis TaxID=1750527 RepID=A0ABM7Y9Y6_9PROT|nr:glutathione S-transferase [Roseomonas fluvialis]BDG74842.1 glutathione S-transferase [Roseomonas fluvialis]
MRLIIGGKWSSTWTMRGWLACKLSGLPFEAETLFLSRPDSKARLAEASPTGLIPVLVDDGFAVTDTLAIAEYLWERAPGCDIWPGDLRARTAARMSAAEMHAHFAELRAAMPMNLLKRWPIANGIPSNAKLLGRPGVEAQVARVQQSWRDTRTAWGAGGPYLFGARFSFADAMWAPMASRFRTYSVALAPDAQAYADAVLAHPLVAEWVEGAHAQAREIGFEACAAWP